MGNTTTTNQDSISIMIKSSQKRKCVQCRNQSELDAAVALHDVDISILKWQDENVCLDNAKITGSISAKNLFIDGGISMTNAKIGLNFLLDNAIIEKGVIIDRCEIHGMLSVKNARIYENFTVASTKIQQGLRVGNSKVLGYINLCRLQTDYILIENTTVEKSFFMSSASAGYLWIDNTKIGEQFCLEHAFINHNIELHSVNIVGHLQLGKSSIFGNLNMDGSFVKNIHHQEANIKGIFSGPTLMDYIHDKGLHNFFISLTAARSLKN